ncbi:MAG: hypothetical protein Q8941_18515 [Bacteroidota bacterium]|nr:hypothetical protein [Bacteroidota bacterium]
MTKKIFIDIICCLFILLFVYTVVSKLPNYNLFKDILSKSPIIGSQAEIVAIVLLIALLWVAILIFFPATRMWGLYGAAALMIIFTLYFTYMIYFSSKLPDSSGGVFKGLTWSQHLAFNIFFLALSLTAIVLQRRKMHNEKERELPPVIFT